MNSPAEDAQGEQPLHPARAERDAARPSGRRAKRVGRVGVGPHAQGRNDDHRRANRVTHVLARLRVPLGFACATLAFSFARPTVASIAVGMSVGAIGELLRIWAAGHIDKGREITRSGPYRYVRHPLYLGSFIMGAGFIVAARAWLPGVLVLLYLGVTLVAAMRTEEATLDARFDGAYAEYRAGRGTAHTRPFSLDRLVANREYRAVAGFIASILLLVLRMKWLAG